jgi:hypothetical protein
MCAMTLPVDRADLRARLLDLRRDALAQLAEAEILDPGLMRLIADAGAALAALDAEAGDGTPRSPSMPRRWAARC